MKSSKESNYFSDQPINSKKDDLLKRASFAEDLAKTFMNWGGEDCLVISINGAWGSGKSSLIKMVEESLLVNHKYPDELIVKFNPWEWSEQKKITEKLFESIEKALEANTGVKPTYNSKETIKQFRKYKELSGVVGSAGIGLQNLAINISDLIILILVLSNFAIDETYLLIIAIVIISLKLLAFIFLDTGKFLGSFASYKSESIGDLEETKNKISHNLKNGFDKNLIIVIDDIDRLTKEEIQNLFQIIKTNANFPKIIFVLLFDKKVAVEALKGLISENGEKFLDKIVQVQIDIPVIDEFKSNRILLDGINDISQELVWASINETEEKWEDLFSQGISHYFNTIRDVYRFLNSFQFYANLFKDKSMYEIYLCDLLCVEILRQFEPDVYHKLYNYKNLLFPNEDQELILDFDALSESNTEPKSFINEFQDTHDGIIKNKHAVKHILQFLFPNKKSSNFEANENNYVSKKELLQKNRLAHRDHFDNYFRFTLNELGFSKSDYFEILDSGNNREKVVKLVEEAIQSVNFEKLIERFESHLDRFEFDNNMQLLLVLTDKIDFLLLHEKLHHKFDKTLQRFVTATKEIISDLNNTSEIKKFYLQLFNNTDALYIPVMLVEDIESVISNFQTKNVKSQNLGRVKTNSAKIVVDIRKYAVNKIRDAAKSSVITSYPWYFHYFVSKWKEWGDSKEVNDWIQELLSEKDGKNQFLKGMLKYDPDGDYFNINEIEIYTDSEKLYNYAKVMVSENIDVDFKKVLKIYMKSFEQQRMKDK
jgi:predicted KAP-like P-loop ATPase